MLARCSGDRPVTLGGRYDTVDVRGADSGALGRHTGDVAQDDDLAGVGA